MHRPRSFPSAAYARSGLSRRAVIERTADGGEEVGIVVASDGEACLLLVREDLLGFWQAVVSDWTDLCAVNCLDELRRIWTPPMWRLDYSI